MATAQQFNLRGVVYKKSTSERVAQVLVTNLRSHDVRISDDLGLFQIPAKAGDTLIFKKLDYATQFFVTFGVTEINISLQPNILLDQVTIKEQSKKQEINELINDYRKKGLYFDGRPPVSAFSPFGGSPITGFYELFGRDARNERHFIQMAKTETEHTEVTKRYNPALIKRVTEMSDDKEVEAFMVMFTPSVEDIREWSDYQLIAYIKKSYDYFRKTKNQPKLPKLY